MQEHFEAVEADLLHHYRVDLRAGIGLRRLRALLNGLPPDSAVSRMVRKGTWPTNEQELLAALIRLVDYGNRLFYTVHKKRNAPDLKAVVVEPPDARAAPDGPRPQSSASDIKRLFKGNVKVVK